MKSFDEDVTDADVEAVATLVVGIIILIPMFLFYTVVTMLSWNWVVPAVFSSLPPIGFLEAFGLVIIITALEWFVKKVFGKLERKEPSLEKFLRVIRKDLFAGAVILLVCFVIHLVLAVMA